MNAVIGWPRSGTHWMREMLNRLTGEEWEHSHHVPEAEGHYVLMIRDPRDSFASHWRLYQHDQREPCTELEFVEMFLKGDQASHLDWNVGWVPHTQALLNWHLRHLDASGLVQYEELYQQPVRVMVALLDRIEGRAAPIEQVAKMVMCTRSTRWDPSTLPVDAQMGRPGKGRNLTPATMAALLDYCGPLMRELGYLR